MRAALLDVARKYYPMPFLDRLVDTLAYYKFNELHVHLNDNGPGTNWSFRIECETYPGLTSRDGSYSKADFRAFVRRSAAKGVNIVPEIDAPAHSRAFVNYNPAFRSEKYGDTHLDLHNPAIYPFFEKLYAEYLGGDEPVFAGPDFSVGTDEYDKSEAEAFRLFTDRMFGYVRKHGKRPRAWGALTHAKGKTPVDPTDVTLDIWHNSYYEPLDALKDGFSLICVPDNLLYIVPNAGYYYDYLNCERLFRRWEPCWFEEVHVDPTNPKLAGGKFAVWNDRGEAGVDIEGTYDRMLPAIATLGQKMWSGTVDGLCWHAFGRRTAKVRGGIGAGTARPAAPQFLVYDLTTGACEELADAPVTGWDDLDMSELLIFKRIRDGLYAAVFKTTQAQWAKFSDDNPSLTHGALHPVDHVSYVMAKPWIAKLAKLTGETGFDIPTNAEWDVLAKDDALVGTDGGAAEWTSDQCEKDPRIRYLRINRTAKPSLNYETSMSGTDCCGFRLVLRKR